MRGLSLPASYLNIEGRKLTVVALDNYRLAMREEENAVFGNENNYSLSYLARLCSSFQSCSATVKKWLLPKFTNKYIIFKIKDIIFSRV
jgi:DNA polymerase III sliding clamp (beta) subunit (PCNA family)